MFKNLDPQRILKQGLAKGGQFADLFIENSSTTLIRLEAGKIEEIVSGIRLGAGLRVLDNFKTYYSFTNRVEQKNLEDLAAATSRPLRRAEKPPLPLALTKQNISPISRIQQPAEARPLREKVKLLRRAEKAARKMDSRIRQVEVLYGEKQRRIALASSEGALAEDSNGYLVFFVRVIAADEHGLQSGYEPAGGVYGFELFDLHDPEELAVTAAKRALLMLEAQPAPSGSMPVVLSSEAGGTMVHEAIGHGLEADLAEQGLSVYSGKIGQTIASPLVTVVDDATLPNRRGSFGMDDEGTPAQRTVLVDKGVLKTYLYDKLEALKQGVQSTGNGRRESFEDKPIVRMSNTLILPGESEPAEIVRSVDKGLFVRRMGGGQVNTVNGDFVFEVEEGYRIEGGRIGEAVRGATLVGNGPAVLQIIDMVGNDLGFGIGTCGKNGQGVPVADAQPTLRIPEITVGGTSLEE